MTETTTLTTVSERRQPLEKPSEESERDKRRKALGLMPKHKIADKTADKENSTVVKEKVVYYDNMNLKAASNTKLVAEINESGGEKSRIEKPGELSLPPAAAPRVQRARKWKRPRQRFREERKVEEGSDISSDMIMGLSFNNHIWICGSDKTCLITRGILTLVMDGMVMCDEVISLPENLKSDGKHIVIDAGDVTCMIVGRYQSLVWTFNDLDEKQAVGLGLCDCFRTDPKVKCRVHIPAKEDFKGKSITNYILMRLRSNSRSDSDRTK